jgi:hypothetical protein
MRLFYNKKKILAGITLVSSVMGFVVSCHLLMSPTLVNAASDASVVIDESGQSCEDHVGAQEKRASIALAFSGGEKDAGTLLPCCYEKQTLGQTIQGDFAPDRSTYLHSIEPIDLSRQFLKVPTVIILNDPPLSVTDTLLTVMKRE